MKKSFLLVGCLLVFTAAASFSFAGDPSGCVKCHTDETLLKSLCSPMAMTASSGEG
jgi:hypothetical protein